MVTTPGKQTARCCRAMALRKDAVGWWGGKADKHSTAPGDVARIIAVTTAMIFTDAGGDRRRRACGICALTKLRWKQQRRGPVRGLTP